MKHTCRATLLLLIATAFIAARMQTGISEGGFVIYKPNPATTTLGLYWKNDSAQLIRSLGNLKTFTAKHGQKLVFAMNGGMYMTDNSPLGLFIQKGKTIRDLNVANAGGNFYMKPNGVFYITGSNKAGVCKTEDWDRINQPKANIQFATQSGPMLVIDGRIHSAFKDGSTNLNIRNGVGILPDGNPVFVMSKEGVNLYDFALLFQQMGCKNALYLDGFVCRTYLPEQKWLQTDGNFGVIIGATERK